MVVRDANFQHSRLSLRSELLSVYYPPRRPYWNSERAVHSTPPHPHVRQTPQVSGRRRSWCVGGGDRVSCGCVGWVVWCFMGGGRRVGKENVLRLWGVSCCFGRVDSAWKCKVTRLPVPLFPQLFSVALVFMLLLLLILWLPGAEGRLC